ncbi:class I fructose-bisphosphate aldolase [Salinisphaera orenii]|uniref:Probable fructose-bisphosphate aldolase class 1 n=1 Tax=Salinisphaera orenii YIM 95161 TaxID=1051139 RepID=A0A423PMG0_9GAMM|nr:class I fructose-bisphosphate aldolase [Salinisphaera halophila]ROO26767.1 fructose-bisphosphate aldolase [Salinisphaera halophila YIM 95161]
MDTQALEQTARAMIADGKGLLAIDESTPTCGKRFADYGIDNTEDNRRDYRALLLSTPGLGENVSGAILYDETLRMTTAEGVAFARMMQDHGIIPGIKVDTGAKDLAGHPGEKVTEGLDGLRERLAEYHDMGARFAKWRAVITIGDGLPSRGCYAANAHALARYAALCQEAGIVPIVEPEVLLDGDHDIDRCYAVTEETLTRLFAELRDQNVHLPGLILKASMVLPGKNAAQQADMREVAAATLRCLYATVPASVPGVAFLSGGQSNEDATAHLDAMNRLDGGRAPWKLTFSYARALQQPALDIWRGEAGNVDKAQAALAHRARCNRAAAQGRYDPAQEKQVA